VDADVRGFVGDGGQVCVLKNAVLDGLQGAGVLLAVGGCGGARG
jgi:hypothetical protein